MSLGEVTLLLEFWCEWNPLAPSTFWRALLYRPSSNLLTATFPTSNFFNGGFQPIFGRRALTTSFFVGATSRVLLVKSRSAGSDSDSVSLSESFLAGENTALLAESFLAVSTRNRLVKAFLSLLFIFPCNFWRSVFFRGFERSTLVKGTFLKSADGFGCTVL